MCNLIQTKRCMKILKLITIRILKLIISHRLDYYRLMELQMLSKRVKNGSKLSKREKNELKLYQNELDELKNTFPKRGVLTMTELANVLNMDVSTLRGKMKEGLEFPRCVNIGSKGAKQLRFTLEEVAKYIVKHNKKSDDKFMVSALLLNELKAIIAKIEKSKIR